MNQQQLESDLDVALEPSRETVPRPEAYVILDTEGSGLFKFKNPDGTPVPADAPGQPRLAALALIYIDANLKVEREYHAYIQPDGWEMEPAATAVNKLTTQFLRGKGLPVGEVLAEFEGAVKEGRVVVAHNAAHDLKHCRAELRRAGRDDLFELTRNICTMRGLTNVCRIPPAGGRGGYKFPRLSEACVHFGFDLLGDHSALGDARACLQLFRKMRELGVTPEAKIHLAKEKGEKS